MNAPLAMSTDDPGDLMTDAACRRELGGISSVTLWKYTNDKSLGFPPPVKIRKRNYRPRKLFDAFKARLIAQALAERSSGAAA
jgi:hypothetical protein